MGCLFLIILAAMCAFGRLIYASFGLVPLLIYIGGLIIVFTIALFES